MMISTSPITSAPASAGVAALTSALAALTLAQERRSGHGCLCVVGLVPAGDGRRAGRVTRRLVGRRVGALVVAHAWSACPTPVAG
jgi:hypothetical protein